MRNPTEFALILLSSDGTYNIYGERVQEVYGFEVAIDAGPVLDKGGDREAAVQRVAEFIEKERRWPHPSRDRRVGSWTDEGGTIFVDLTAFVVDRERALSLGRAHSQKAIWDWAANAAVEVPHA
jgi:hypothetical protein